MPTGRRIRIVEHDASWSDRATTTMTDLRESADRTEASDEVVAIKHIGSTAVPGLAAKPVIDLMVGLRRWPAPEVLIRSFEALGLHHRGENGLAGRHYFTDAPPGEPRTTHVHAVEHGGWFWREHLRFRDHLRRCPEDAARYAELKRKLVRRHPRDAFAYTEAKRNFVRDVLARAREESGDPRTAAAAQSGFAAAADAYERSRPGYPDGAIAVLAEQLGLGPGRRVIDVGAGTGKLTRPLLSTRATVDAVEPLPAMRDVLQREVAEATVIDGTAEELPLRAGTADAVVAGQAFHWFDRWMALSEAHRVLRDSRGVGLVWNVRDDTVDWVRRWDQLAASVTDGAPCARGDRWRTAVETTELFTSPRTVTFPNPHVVPRETVIERFASSSSVAALNEQPRAELLDGFRTMLDSHPQTRGRDRITVPYRTEVHTFHRRP